jgi:CRP-like cAMP-binding protein
MASDTLLRNVYLFKEMDRDEMDPILKSVTVQPLQKGDRVFSQDDEANALYIIKFGSVRILQKSGKGDNVEVSVLGTGSHFGELPLVDAGKRSATVEATEKTEVLRIDYSGLKQALQTNPMAAMKFYRALAHFLAGRLRVTTTDLSFAREMNLRHF